MNRVRKTIELDCEYCGDSFKKSIHHYNHEKNRPNKKWFCSKACFSLYKNKRKNVVCKNCGISFEKKEYEIINHPNHFCSRSCAAKYNNTHKSVGNRRSKLEIWLELKLKEKYSNLEIHFNRKDAINSELDIYFPDLKLAFELNGIFHYEPIYGPEKLSKIQNNDDRKFQACLEKGIELCIIDTSQQKYFKEASSQEYLDIISLIVEQRLAQII
jgi:transcription elongation factor Elf1